MWMRHATFSSPSNLQNTSSCCTSKVCIFKDCSTNEVKQIHWKRSHTSLGWVEEIYNTSLLFVL